MSASEPVPHVLDRPVWSTLSTRQAALSLGDDRARRMIGDYGVFAAAADDSPEALAALAALVRADGPLWTVEADARPIPPGLVAGMSAECWQMTTDALTPVALDTAEVVDLSDDDAAEMLALATLTKPGPFFARTHQLGAFVGVKHDGRLVAMAGERMRPPGFTEVSGVCTHPDARGRGYGGLLSRVVAGRILARGEGAFLHCYSTNAAAISLYESLGFRLRRTVTATVLEAG